MHVGTSGSRARGWRGPGCGHSRTANPEVVAVFDHDVRGVGAHRVHLQHELGLRFRQPEDLARRRNEDARHYLKLAAPAPNTRHSHGSSGSCGDSGRDGHQAQGTGLTHHPPQEKVLCRQRLPYTFAPAAPRETPASRTLEDDGQASWTRGTAWDLSSASATARRGGSAAEAGALQHGRSEQHGLGGRFKEYQRSKASQNSRTSILTPEW